MRTKSRQQPQDPPANFEEVKRRYIRQNRDLAKGNTTLSLRIRALELEVSNLLDVNTGLREELIRLGREAQDAKAQSSREAVRSLKDAMAAKVRELAGLVDDVDEDAHVQEMTEDDQEERKSRYLGGVDFKERQPLAELMRDNQMPTISENHSFPRRTLDAASIRALRLSDPSSTESPDLGPPPVARLDDDAPIKFDPHIEEAPRDDMSSADELRTVIEDEDVPASASVNVEARRKRKDGSSSIQIRRRSILPTEPSGEGDDLAPNLRTSAKRKLSDRDGEKQTKPATKDDFSFVSKAPAEESQPPERNSAEDLEPVSRLPADVPVSLPSRKVLGDKSINMSPKKPERLTEKGGKDDWKKGPSILRANASKEQNSIRRRRIAHITLPAAKHDVVMDCIVPSALPELESKPEEFRPTTPAAPDLFSPASSAPSTKPTGNSDTPPPDDVSMASSAASREVSRPSRRASAAVNYAEPSLVAKMRRPSKQLVDALGGIQDPRRAMSVSSGKKSLRGAEAKKEFQDERDEAAGWKDLAESEDAVLSRQSPLGKRGAADTVDQIKTDEVDELKSERISASSTSKAMLMPGTNLRRSRTSEVGLARNFDPVRREPENTDIYDFKESSSSPPSVTGADPGQAAVQSRRTQRRHSSAPKDLLEKSVTQIPESKTFVADGEREERAVGRRRSMMV